MTSSFSAVDKPGVNSIESSSENSSFGSSGDSRAAAESVVTVTPVPTEASDSIAMPQAADLGLHADVGSSSFSGVESAFDAADAAADLNKAPVHEPVLHAAGCACAACRGGSADSQLSSGAGSGDDFSAASLGTLDQLADYLETVFWNDFGTVNRNFNLGATGTSPKSGALTYNTSSNSQDANGLTAARASLVDEAFKLFESTLGIDFQLTTAAGSDFRFGDNQNGAFASYNLSSSITNYANINVNSSWYGGLSGFGNYTFQTILHEIGHGLGLGHQGLYNGTGEYSTDADFTNDSWQASMMSYFSQTDNTSIDASYAFLSTPMVADWIALDDLYGSYGYGISNAFLGNTTYGFNTTISAGTSTIFNELKDWIPTTAFTVVDGGGDDTLDFSGFSDTQLIDLRPSDKSATNVYASNIGGKTGNLTIAPGTFIEAAIGGSGDDQIRGNTSNNTLDGGLGTDTALFSGAFSDYSFSNVGAVLKITDLRGGSSDGVDTLSNFEFVDFAGDTRTWSSLISGGGGGGGGGGGSSTPAPSPAPIPESNPPHDGFTHLSNNDDRLTEQSDIKLRMLGGNDYLEVTGGTNFANGNMGEDTIILRGGFGKYLGGKDSDTVEVFGSEEATSVNGNRGEDYITGTVAGVIYRGGKDNDLLAVSQGEVWGDKQADTFRGVVGDGIAVIQDYTIGEDFVEIDIQGGWSNVGDGLMFTNDNGDQIMLLLGIDNVEQVTLL